MVRADDLGVPAYETQPGEKESGMTTYNGKAVFYQWSGPPYCLTLREVDKDGPIIVESGEYYSHALALSDASERFWALPGAGI